MACKESGAIPLRTAASSSPHPEGCVQVGTEGLLDAEEGIPRGDEGADYLLGRRGPFFRPSTALTRRICFLNNSRPTHLRKGIRIEGKEKVVYLSQILQFDKKRFDALADGALNFIVPYVSAEERKVLKQGNFEAEYLDYIWKASEIKKVQEPG
jgi:hypothetical protein